MSAPAKKILFIVLHRFNRSPGQRYRFEQYLQYLEQNGFQCTFSPIILNEKEDYTLYNSTSKIGKAFIFLKGFLRRLRHVLMARNYDIVFVFREAFMAGPAFFERWLKKTGAKMIFDFDDAIWLPTISEANRSLQWLKKPEKTADIIKMSDLVIAGNSYLANYAQQFNQNVVVFPSTVDLDLYKPVPKIETGKVVIGWSGSHTTIEHFNLIVPVLKSLRKKYGNLLEFIVYGDPHYKNEELNIKGIAWSPESEVPVISSFDIGIMPLPDTEWTRGKCAMKGLQYMGLGIPAVLASVGMNKDVIRDGVNGFIASTEQEWIDKLSLLIENKVMRKTFGIAGRKTIEENFSAQALRPTYLNIINQVLS